MGVNSGINSEGRRESIGQGEGGDTPELLVHLRRATGSGDSNIKEINIFYEYFLLVCGLLFRFLLKSKRFLIPRKWNLSKFFYDLCFLYPKTFLSNPRLKSFALFFF